MEEINNTISVSEFENECLALKYSKYIFTDENLEQNTNLRFALSFNRLKVIYYTVYNSILLGTKDNHIVFDNVVCIERNIDLDFCKSYILYCESNGESKLRKFEIIALT